MYERYAVAATLIAASATVAAGMALAQDNGNSVEVMASGSPVELKPGFRLLLYLQSPPSDSMTVVWVSEQNTAGALVVVGPGMTWKMYSSDRCPLDLMHYSEAELTQEIDGLETGSWLRSDGNYQHVVRIDGLQSGEKYCYTVVQDDVHHYAGFTTAPDNHQWDHIRIITSADTDTDTETETEPRGRVQHCEWETAHAGFTEGSVERPGIESK